MSANDTGRAYSRSQTYLVSYWNNANQVPFVRRLVNPFFYTSLLMVHIHVKLTDVISPRRKLHVAMLFIKREVLDVDSTDALKHGRRHPRVVAIVGQ